MKKRILAMLLSMLMLIATACNIVKEDEIDESERNAGNVPTDQNNQS